MPSSRSNIVSQKNIEEYQTRFEAEKRGLIENRLKDIFGKDTRITSFDTDDAGELYLKDRSRCVMQVARIRKDLKDYEVYSFTDMNGHDRGSITVGYFMAKTKVAKKEEHHTLPYIKSLQETEAPTTEHKIKIDANKARQKQKDLDKERKAARHHKHAVMRGEESGVTQALTESGKAKRQWVEALFSKDPHFKKVATRKSRAAMTALKTEQSQSSMHYEYHAPYLSDELEPPPLPQRVKKEKFAHGGGATEIEYSKNGLIVKDFDASGILKLQAKYKDDALVEAAEFDFKGKKTTIPNERYERIINKGNHDWVSALLRAYPNRRQPDWAKR